MRRCMWSRKPREWGDHGPVGVIAPKINKYFLLIDWLTFGSSPYGPDTPRPYRRSLVPHNLTSTQKSPVALPKFQMAHRLKILMTSGSKKGTQIYFSFLSANEPPPRSPTGPQWRERPAYREFCISLKILIFRFPQQRSPPSMSPSWNTSQRDAPPLEPFFIHPSKPPYMSPSPHTRFPSAGQGPPWRDACIRRLS